jgi:hypothetical protein
MKHWTPKTMLCWIQLTNYVIAPIAKKAKEKNKKRVVPSISPYGSLHFFSQVCFKLSTKAN